jgi:hypothetical protein
VSRAFVSVSREISNPQSAQRARTASTGALKYLPQRGQARARFFTSSKSFRRSSSGTLKARAAREGDEPGRFEPHWIVALQPCSVCHSLVAPNATTCPSCGIPRTLSAPPTPAQQASYALPQQYVPPLAPSAWFAPQAQHQSVRLAHGGSDACPRCFEYLHSNRYTLLHLLIALCWFPVGFLIFAAPIKRCQRGQEYGLGRFIVTVCSWLAVATTILILFMLAALSRH